MNGWSSKVYTQGFDFETVMFKPFINIFERMEIATSFYKGVVGTS